MTLHHPLSCQHPIPVTKKLLLSKTKPQCQSISKDINVALHSETNEVFMLYQFIALAADHFDLNVKVFYFRFTYQKHTPHPKSYWMLDFKIMKKIFQEKLTFEQVKLQMN